jgi:hypothetical protein
MERRIKEGRSRLEADEPITAAVGMMLNRNVTAVPVVEGRHGDRRFIGMVHLRDVLGALVFESATSYGRDAANGQHARHGGRPADQDRSLYGYSTGTDHARGIHRRHAVHRA